MVTFVERFRWLPCLLVLLDFAVCQMPHTLVPLRDHLASNIRDSLFPSLVNTARGRLSQPMRLGPLSRSSILGALSSYRCPRVNGLSCNGNGLCMSGACLCSVGYSGTSCEVAMHRLQFFNGREFPTTTAVRTYAPSTPLWTPRVACMDGAGDVCSGHGTCRHNLCVCASGWSGRMCELSGAGGFCNAYRACAECIAFLEDSCPNECQIIARFYLVYDFPTTASSFQRCRSRSRERRCSFYYQMDGTLPDGRKNIMVKACLGYRDDSYQNTTSTASTTQAVTIVPEFTSTEWMTLWNESTSIIPEYRQTSDGQLETTTISTDYRQTSDGQLETTTISTDYGQTVGEQHEFTSIAAVRSTTPQTVDEEEEDSVGPAEVEKAQETDAGRMSSLGGQPGSKASLTSRTSVLTVVSVFIVLLSYFYF